MFYAPEILRRNRKGELVTLWLAGTLSEAMFKKKVSKIRISKINIEVSSEEIIKIVSGRGFNGTPRFSLYLSANLLYGLIKVFAYQSNDLQKFATKCCEDLSSRLVVSKKKNEKSTTEIKLDYQAFTVDISAPDLSDFLNRPTPYDVNRIFEISPESHKRMMEARDTQWDFRMSDEEIDFSIPSIADITREDMAKLIPGFHDDPIVEEIVVGASQKRLLSPGTIVDSPSKRQRVPKSLGEEVRTGFSVAYDRGDATVLPMESNNEPHSLPIDTSNDVVPVDVRDPLDNLPVGNVAEPIDVTAPLDTVVPVDNVVPEDPSLSIPIVQPTMQPRNKPHRGKQIDSKICRPDNKQLGHRDNQAHVVSMLIAHPGRLIAPLKQLLSRDLNSGNQHTSNILPRLPSNIKELTIIDVREATTIDVLDRFEDANYFSLNTRDLQCDEKLEPYLSKDLLSTVEDKFVQGDKETKTCTIDEPVEGIVQQLSKILPPETMNDPTFDNVSAVPFPFENIENTELSEHTSGPKTVSVGKVEMLTDPPGNEDTIDRFPTVDPVVDNLDDFLPPLPPKDQRASTKIRQSNIKSFDASIDITSKPSSPRLEIAEESAWTKKDLEACLEVHFHDRDIVTFEYLASPNDTTVIEAIDAFYLILELYSDGKIDLTQDETNGPLIIKKTRHFRIHGD